MFFKSVVVALLMVFYMTNVCEAIQCYVCQSAVNNKCGINTFEGLDTFKRNCDLASKPPNFLDADKPTKCSLVVTSDGFTYRDCHWEHRGSKQTECFSDQVTRPSVCKSCDSDYCNSAPKVYGAIGATILMALVSIFLH